MKRFLAFAPLAVLAVLAIVFAGWSLKRDPHVQPHALVGKPAPAIALATLDGGAPVSTRQGANGPFLINFFASWCEGCQVEHPVLLKLARESKVEIIGMDYKDKPEDVATWLTRHGNPYRKVVLDEQGSAGLDWGVYGVPETFVLDANGVIVYKQIGPMTEEAWRTKIAPLMAGAKS